MLRNFHKEKTTMHQIFGNCRKPHPNFKKPKSDVEFNIHDGGGHHLVFTKIGKTSEKNRL